MPEPLPPLFDDRPDWVKRAEEKPNGVYFREARAKVVNLVRRFFLPQNIYYRALVRALLITFAVIWLPLYYLGASNEAAKSVVFWIWRTSAFGLWSDTLPYMCGGDLFCSAQYRGDANWLLAGIFFVAGAISIRAIILCLEHLETALGTNLVARLLNKFLPEGKASSRPASPTPSGTDEP